MAEPSPGRDVRKRRQKTSARSGSARAGSEVGATLWALSGLLLASPVLTLARMGIWERFAVLVQVYAFLVPWPPSPVRIPPRLRQRSMGSKNGPILILRYCCPPVAPGFA
jgi:hypothetical protein